MLLKKKKGQTLSIGTSKDEIYFYSTKKEKRKKKKKVKSSMTFIFILSIKGI